MSIVSTDDFEQLYQANKEMVWALVCRYINGQQDREDLFQEIFVNVHRALPRYRGQAAVATWIYRIAVNTALNHLKRLRREAALKKAVSLFAPVKTEEITEPADQADWRPLEKLNPRQRMIVVLADIEEKNLEEIAALLAIPVGTVKSNLYRAREIIKKELKSND